MNPDRAYERVVGDLLGESEVETGRMFRAEGLRYRAKYFAMLHRDELVVKLPAARVTELENAGAGARFEPGHGRIMREWIAVPVAQQHTWQAFATEALQFARQNAATPHR